MICTVVSLCPFPLNESKPGLLPRQEFNFPAAEKGKMSIIHVDDGWHMIYIDAERGSIRVNDAAQQIASAIVYDCIVSKPYGVVPGEAEPGIFWVEGKLTEKEILAKHSALYETTLARMKKWFENLVAEADDTWNKFHSHKMISDTCRLAAKYLGLERPWNIQATVENMTECPACTTIIPARAIVCPQCAVILNKEKYSQLSFAGVK